MTYNEFKSGAILRLSNVCENPTFEAECIIMHFSGFKRNELLLNRASVIPGDVLEKLNQAIDLRLQRHPLQYIIGEWEFFGLRMFCGQGCLIPRPETELLAETVIKKLPRNGKVLDLCTGSGCIPVAILNNRPDAKAVAVDISKDALFYAKKNAEYHNITDSRLKIVNADIYNYTPDDMFDIIISNPPYIKSDDIPKLEPEVQFEPKIALDGGHDGLDFYKLIAKFYANKLLTNNGYCIVEVGYDIAQEVAAIFRSLKFETHLLRDMFEVERVCVARKSV